MAKRGFKGCGKVLLKDIETQPWRDCCADLSGPWTAHANDKDTEFHALTLIDPFASWAETVPAKTKKAPCIRDLILNHWFRQHPRPSRFIFDQGSEFDNSWSHTLLRQWHMKPEPMMVKNPQANAVVERPHKIVADVLHVQLTCCHQHDDPVSDLLQAAAHGICATSHGATGHSPGHFICNKCMTL